MRYSKAVFLIAFTISTCLHAQTTNTKTKSESQRIPGHDDIRCEQISGGSLSDFKSKLVENCDLSKPFSSSLSRLINDNSYLYCCNKR